MIVLDHWSFYLGMTIHVDGSCLCHVKVQSCFEIAVISMPPCFGNHFLPSNHGLNAWLGGSNL